MKCPICGGKKTAPILYGMPAYDEEMEKKIREQKIYLGGCLFAPVNPQYHCFSCEEDFYDPCDREKRELNEKIIKAHERRERSGI